ncbi:hypothetical protein [Streptomyces sp. NPDC005438]|uniref:hypothetical protein n=1 Tax=Streptomyces sp. NPDC005438 TaxID=3156880 RepID=UPI0033B5B2E8
MGLRLHADPGAVNTPTLRDWGEGELLCARSAERLGQGVHRPRPRTALGFDDVFLQTERAEVGFPAGAHGRGFPSEPGPEAVPDRQG